MALTSTGCEIGGSRPAGTDGSSSARADSEKPGTVMRRGPATAEAIADPPAVPSVRGGQGQLSIYDGFFLAAPCAGEPRVDASRRQDTVLVRIVSEPAAVPTESCDEEARAWGYSLLVGPFQPDEYPVRVVHEGDLERPPLDTVFSDVAIEPRGS